MDDEAYLEKLEDDHKYSVYKVASSIIIPYIALFAFINLKTNGLWAASQIAIFPLVIFLIRISIPHFPKKELAYFLTLTLVYIHLFRLYLIGGSDGSNLFWVVVTPAFPFMLLSIKDALLAFFLFTMAIIGTFIITRIYPLAIYQYPSSVFFRFLFAYWGIAIFSYLYERIRLNYRTLYNGKHRELVKIQKKIVKLSYYDSLTSCFNRHYLDENIEKEMARAKRYHFPLSIIMIDIDDFKKINDSYGHNKGDLVLESLGSLLNQSVRCQVDWVVRFGGEEFLLILPNTDCDGAFGLAERIRTSFHKRRFLFSDDKVFSISCGVSQMSHKEEEDFDSLFQEADLNLYKAKEGGKNRVVVTLGDHDTV